MKNILFIIYIMIMLPHLSFTHDKTIEITKITGTNNNNSYKPNTGLASHAISVTPSLVKLNYNPLTQMHTIKFTLKSIAKIGDLELYSNIQDATYSIRQINKNELRIYYSVPDLLYSKRKENYINFIVESDNKMIFETIPIQINSAIENYSPKLLIIPSLNETSYIEKQIKFHTTLKPSILASFIEINSNAVVKDIYQTSESEVTLVLSIQKKYVDEIEVTYLTIKDFNNKIKIPLIFADE